MSTAHLGRRAFVPLLLGSGLLVVQTARGWVRSTSPAPVVFRLRPASRFEVRTGKAGLFGFAGHSHLVRARSFNGWVVYRGDDPSASRLEVTIPAESLEVLTPSDTAEIRKVAETMRTQVLRVGQYPEIRFTATVAAPTAKGFRLQGELTMVGRTRPVPVDVAVRLAGDTLEANGEFTVKQSDFGIKPVRAGPGGTVKVADRVKFVFDAVGVRDPAAVTDSTGSPVARAPR
jgi:polyisoprenoid-binding protein YceI